jgi:hypothetical protein
MKGPRTTVRLNGVLVTDYDGAPPVPAKKGIYELTAVRARYRLYRYPAPRRSRVGHLKEISLQ